MHKGLIITLSFMLFAIIPASELFGQVYKVVDEDGNVTYTDEPPEPGAEPMELPEISIIETESAPSSVTPTGQNNVNDIKTPRELRRQYSDFRILEPSPEQTYWGTENTVVVSWGADVAYEEGMSVSVVVNGKSYDSEPSGNLSVTLDRGEHQVYAILKDQRGRRIVTSDVVTFYVKQASRLGSPG